MNDKTKSKTKESPSNQRTLGPVANLEEHVPPDWWRGLFTGLYLKTDADVVMDPALTNTEVDLIIQALDLQPNEHILDLCCGQGRHTIELASRGYDLVEGLDRSSHLIQRARRTARTQNLSVRFREGDARRLPFPDNSLDVVLLLGNSFGYFESAAEDMTVLHEIARVMRSEGRLLIDVADGDYLRQHYVPRAWEWVDRRIFVCRERSLASDGRRLISREIVTDANEGVIADQFYSERLYSPEELRLLLEEAGFSEPQLHSEMETQSQRNQDLGMMARRLIMSAQLKEHRPRRGDYWTFRDVVVVMGDPTIPDPVKPDSTFDDDDFETIEKLENALKERTAFNFSFLNNHRTLYEDLRRSSDEIDLVLNLCDEGYGNRPQWELHVPTVLEMLGIYYTGSGPQCLAYCYDKSLVRGIAQEMNIDVPPAILMTPTDSIVDLPFAFPAIIKPNFGDSSFGITKDSVVNSPSELLKALRRVRDQFGYHQPVLVEAFLPGKDLTVGIIGNPPYEHKLLPIVEEDYSVLPEDLPHICGYEAKWDPDSPYWKLRSIPANLPSETNRAIKSACLKLFERLECRDYARFDWRLDAEGTPRLLEVNPNPGWCWDGHLAKMAGLEGMSYGQMLEEIIKAAELRLQRTPALPHPIAG